MQIQISRHVGSSNGRRAAFSGHMVGEVIETAVEERLEFGRSANGDVFELLSQPIRHAAPGTGSERTPLPSDWRYPNAPSGFSLHIGGPDTWAPDWHSETAEMGCVIEGSGRMTVTGPDGRSETCVIQAGDVYFVPPAYPHRIENIGEGALHVLVFFSRAMRNATNASL